MSLKFNFGSASPSTPSRKGKSSPFTAPSTTPAGNPPSHLTNFSTTPAGNPPRSSQIFGSSYNATNNTFGKRGFAVPESSPPRAEDEGYDDEEDAEGEEKSEDDDIWAPRKEDMLAESPRGLKRSRNGEVLEREGSGMVEIARAMSRDPGPAQKLEESDDVVLETQRILVKMDENIHHQETSLEQREQVITSSTAELAKLWTQHSDTTTLSDNIGPEADDAVSKATYLSTLILQLHNPYTTKPTQTLRNKSLILSSRQQTQQSLSTTLPRALLDWLNTHHNPLPDEFESVHLHRPSPAAHKDFWDTLGAELLRGRFERAIRLLKDAGWQNAKTAREDIGPQARGYSGRQLESIEEVMARCIRLLESCPAVTTDDWNIAGTDWELFRQQVRHAIRDLETYASSDNAAPPAHKEPSNIFAKASMTAATSRAESRVPFEIYTELKIIYGMFLGGNGLLDLCQDWLEGAILLTAWWDGEDNASLDTSLAALNVSQAGRKSLRRGAGAETTIREVDVAPLVAYRKRLEEMFAAVTSEIDEKGFRPDSLDPVQVGLACAMEGSVQGVIDVLRTWSPTIATAVVELAAVGGWLPRSAGSSSKGLLEKGFSSEDLMVLSHGRPPGGQQRQDDEEGGIDRDAGFADYAELLAEKDGFQSEDGSIQKEGWELALGVLSRLDDIDTAEDQIRGILERVQIDDESRVETVLQVCQSMGWAELGRGIAERYADAISTQSPPPYGSALIYYARAHATTQLKQTLSLLISACLLQSAAMPPQASLDPQLTALLSKDRAALVSLSKVDVEAASLLSRHLSGYATLRRFYELRDQDVADPASSSTATLKSKLGPLERKREAAKALIAVIESASDCIKGGLFDPEIQGVVPVEGLLVLLGESLPLLGQPKRILEMKHTLGLMSVIEDFEAVSGRIREGATGLLQASMNAYHSNGHSSMKKSKSDVSSTSDSGFLSGGSSWEQLAESSFVMLRSTESVKSTGSEKSGRSQKKPKMVEVQRAWDWRKGLDGIKKTGMEVGCKEVVMLLRTALAREVARGWSGGR